MHFADSRTGLANSWTELETVFLAINPNPFSTADIIIKQQLLVQVFFTIIKGAYAHLE